MSVKGSQKDVKENAYSQISVPINYKNDDKSIGIDKYKDFNRGTFTNICKMAQ